ncbi:MAG TPA: hypothetical protein EYQ42_09045 [Thiotrichaceae bacterium]|jgi:hypothetical protein|nr:hypothetical protein [Thiotrichaceae bacterium]
MDIKSYTDSDDIYIPSYQANYSDYYNYEKFISGLKGSEAVAIKLPVVSQATRYRFSDRK